MAAANLVVVKDNKLIEASYSLTLAEQRILLACIAKIDSTSELRPDHVFNVEASEIVDLMSVERSNAYRDIKTAINKLYDRSIKIDSHGSEMRWIYRKEYSSDGGRATLYFSPEIIPYLSQLKANFTKYKLEYVTHFKSAYGIRLYELLVQWTSVGEREVSIEWLRDRFQIADKYSSIKDLKNRVIDPAVRDINDHSNLWVEYGQRKTGRTVSHIQFKFGVKAQNQQPQLQKQKWLTDDEINAYVQQNPAATKGKSKPEVIALMKKPKAPEKANNKALKHLAEAKKTLG